MTGHFPRYQTEKHIMRQDSSRILSRFLLLSAFALSLPLGAQAAGSAAAKNAAPARDAAPADAPCDCPMGHRPPPMMHGPEGRGPEGGGPEMRGPGMPGPLPMMRELKLSAEQRGQLRKLFEEQREAMRTQHDAVREARDALRDYGMAADYSEAKAQSLAQDLGSKEAGLALFMAQQARRMNEVLTPEQRQQLAARLAERPQPRPEGRPEPGRGPEPR